MFIMLLKIGVLLFISFLSAAAQEKSSPTKTELIGQFATLTKANRLDIKVELSLDDVSKRMVAMIDGDKDLDDSQKQELKKAGKDLFGRLQQQTEKQLSDNSVLAKLGEQVITGVYDKAFTEAELIDLISFFKTPLGQKAADFLATSKGQIETQFRMAMESKIQEISQPIINASIEELRQRITAIKKK